MVNPREVLSKALSSLNATAATTKKTTSEVSALRQEMNARITDLTALLEAQTELNRAQLKTMEALRREARQNRRYLEVLRLSATREVCDDVERFTAGRQLPLLETVELLSDKSMSFTRFGDGEFRQMLRPDYHLKFQRNSPELRESLRLVLESPAPGLLVGFPSVFRDIHGSAVWSDIWRQLAPLVDHIERFGNSHVSRPLFFQQHGEDGVEAWRQVWAKEDVCIITGRRSRFELVPALFSSARTVRRVDSEPINAFSDLPRLLSDDVLGEADVYLVSLGPAGTVLANELAKRGKRVIDIGHISDSYLHVFEDSAWPEDKAATK